MVHRSCGTLIVRLHTIQRDASGGQWLQAVPVLPGTAMPTVRGVGNHARAIWSREREARGLSGGEVVKRGPPWFRFLPAMRTTRALEQPLATACHGLPACRVKARWAVLVRAFTEANT